MNDKKESAFTMIGDIQPEALFNPPIRRNGRRMFKMSQEEMHAFFHRYENPDHWAEIKRRYFG
jgi:hypothetical protein